MVNVQVALEGQLYQSLPETSVEAARLVSSQSRYPSYHAIYDWTMFLSDLAADPRMCDHDLNMCDTFPCDLVVGAD